jgi:ABC-type transport system involved in multi-copper enzyme maturation permease subunit
MDQLKAMIRIQFEGSRNLVLALAVAAFALPIVSVRSGWSGSDRNLTAFLTELSVWGLLYPVLAAVAAAVLSVSIWGSDRRGSHVYALLLPVQRWQYVLLRYLGGLALLAPIAMALWLGAIIGAASVDLPPGLRTFPHALAAKFTISLILLFGLAFSFAAASRRALGIGFRLLGLLVAVHFGVIMVRPGINLFSTIVSALATPPGPLAPLGGRWMLIDV